LDKSLDPHVEVVDWVFGVVLQSFGPVPAPLAEDDMEYDL
jgi:hypothetical protein